MAERLTAESVRADVAALLYVNADEIAEGDDLFESGLDSIRLLTLLEKWREAGVVVSFVELAEQPTLADWSRLLTTRQPVVLDA
jgi:aryl carrier-like protein